MWKTLGLWTKKAIEHISLMGYATRSLEDTRAESNVDCGAPSQRFQMGTVSATVLETMPRENQAKNVADFCPSFKDLPEAKLKSFELILSVEEISRQPSIDCHMDISGHSYADLQPKGTSMALP